MAQDQKTLYFHAGVALFEEGHPRPEGTSWQAKSKQEGWDSAKTEDANVKAKPSQDDGKTKEPQGTPEGDKQKIDEIKKEEQDKEEKERKDKEEKDKAGEVPPAPPEPVPAPTPTPAPAPEVPPPTPSPEPAPPPEVSPEEEPDEEEEEEEEEQEEPPAPSPGPSPGPSPPPEPGGTFPQAVAAHITKLEEQIEKSSPRKAQQLRQKIERLRSRHTR